MTVKIIVWGMGKLGRAAIDVCLDAPSVEIVAVVTQRPEAVSGLPPGTLVVTDLAAARAVVGDALVMHCGHAVGDDLAVPLAECADLGLDVVTSSGLFDPGSQLADGGSALGDLARSRGTRIVTSGVQPGFVLDVLPTTVLDLAPGWRRVTAVKPSDARSWPVDIRHVQCIGVPPEELDSEIVYPLGASARLLAAGAGCEVERIDEVKVAEVTTDDLVLADETIRAGLTCGFSQECTAYLSDGRVVTLVWRPTVRVVDGVDLSLRVTVEGESWLELSLDGAFREDPYPATAQRMLHVGAAALRLAPGLHRVTDVGLGWPGL